MYSKYLWKFYNKYLWKIYNKYLREIDKLPAGIIE